MKNKKWAIALINVIAQRKNKFIRGKKMINKETIKKLACELLSDSGEYEKMSHAVNPYGDGLASERIADAILYYFGVKSEKPEDFSAE